MSGVVLGTVDMEAPLDVNETFREIWPDADWVEGSELRQSLTLKQLLQMRAGLIMPS